MKTTTRTLWNSILVVFLGTLLARQAGGQTLFNLLKTVDLQSNARGGVTVNRALNKIYVSGNPSDNVDIEVNVIDGVSLLPPTDVGYGDGTSVDIKSNRYWSTTI